MNKLTKYTIAIGIQISILLIMIMYKILVMSEGTELSFRVGPVDPRSPLRGDYVTLKYLDISEIPYDTPGASDISYGNVVYVILKKSKDGNYLLTKVQNTKPKNKEEIFIKGKASSGYTYYAKFVTIKYGIEDYFIPEGKGQQSSLASGRAVAKVMVDENGNAVLKQIQINGKPWP